jgi:radical SAM protein (TIGR01212 family)
MSYNKYSDYLKNKYGEKVYKLPINISGGCPNKDGFLGTGGCIYCDSKGSGFETLEGTLSVKNQIETNMNYIGKNYGTKKFIAYFQTFTNTYMPFETFKENIESLLNYENIVGISISTRPDCINDEILNLLYHISDSFNMDITFELGLQTVNYHTLERINRGHTLGEFIDASLRIKKYPFDLCAHVILNLPWDTTLDAIEGAKILSALSCDSVKVHSLYILKDTSIGRQYLEGTFDIISKEEYVERVILFLEYLSPDIVIQRLLARAPKEETLFCNWETSWWKIQEEIEDKMKRENRKQGVKFNYLNGKALKNPKFNLYL